MCTNLRNAVTTSIVSFPGPFVRTLKKLAPDIFSSIIFYWVPLQCSWWNWCHSVYSNMLFQCQHHAFPPALKFAGILKAAFLLLLWNTQFQILISSLQNRLMACFWYQMWWVAAKSNALLWGSPRAWSLALLTRRLVDPVKAQAVKKFFIPFNLSAWVLHAEQFKLTTWSPLSAFITSHSLPKCSAKDVVFQRFAAATVRALVFLADGVDDTAVEGQSLVSVEALDGLQS